jgi:zinc protease
MFIKKFVFTAAAGLLAFSVNAQSIPLDPAVRTGMLSNGFTYYIRHNEEPKKRVELYLINKVGSILEDDDQQGLAHFMEHMNFNGTKNYPKNELVDFLQKSGVRFGADLNAYTSFDETVYQLPMPTEDPAMFGKGLNIMRDWAQEALLDPGEIEKERGVVLEEERLGKGSKDRMSRQYFPMLLNHARYADRLPIGKDFVLTKFKPQVIGRFYKDWYRPDLQALIIVGDVNVDEAEKMIKEKFSTLVNPDQERERVKYTVPLTGKSQFMVVTDPEESSTGIEILMKHKASELKTEKDYISQIKTSLLNQLLSTRRYAETSRDKDPAYTSSNLGISTLLNNVDMFSVSVNAKEGRIEQSFEQIWRILERIKRYGFSQLEFDRIKQNYLRGLQSNLNEFGKTSSVNYVKEYQSLFLHGEASPGIAWEYQFTKANLDAITLADITALLNEYLASKDIDVLVSGPEKVKALLPDSSTVNKWIRNVSDEKLAPFAEEITNKPLISKMPKPGSITSKTEIAGIGATKVILSNGVTVILKPTDFKHDQVLYGAFSPGGTSLYDQKDFDAATNAAALISRFGLSDFTPVQLSQMLTGKIVNSSVNITQRSQTVMASAAPNDLETALQLTYLQFTAPRKDELIFKNTIDNAVASLTNRYADPNQVFADSIAYVLGNYSYRAAPPTIARLNEIAPDQVYQIYEERFSDASSFTFVFVGNFETGKILSLLEKYLGSLPSVNKDAKARDLGIHIPEGKFVKKVYKGTENKATVRVVFSGDYQYSPLANLQLKALGDILQIRVLEKLREAEGEVYSPQVQISYNKNPKNRFSLVISFGCAPENTDHLVQMTEKEMVNLRQQGPTTTEIQKFKAQYEKNVELALKDNGFWLSYLLGQYENKEDVMQVNDTQKNLSLIEVKSLKEAAALFLSGKNMITFQLLPEKSK